MPRAGGAGAVADQVHLRRPGEPASAGRLHARRLGARAPELAALMRALPMLQRLCIGATPMTDAVFVLFPPRPALRSLEIQGSYHLPRELTAVGFMSLGHAFPRLQCLLLDVDGKAREWAQKVERLRRRRHHRRALPPRPPSASTP
jgi:hypothetical protein